jgi:hypothetical protein
VRLAGTCVEVKAPPHESQTFRYPANLDGLEMAFVSILNRWSLTGRLCTPLMLSGLRGVVRLMKFPGALPACAWKI